MRSGQAWEEERAREAAAEAAIESMLVSVVYQAAALAKGKLRVCAARVSTQRIAASNTKRLTGTRSQNARTLRKGVIDASHSHQRVLLVLYRENNQIRSRSRMIAVQIRVM